MSFLKIATFKAQQPLRLGILVGLMLAGTALIATTSYVLAKAAQSSVAKMTTAVPLDTLTSALPSELKGVSPQRKKLDVTYFGKGSGTNIRLDFVGRVEWRLQKPRYQHTVSVAVDPTGFVTAIERSIGYEIGHKSPPQLSGVVSGLTQKYGKPQQVEKYPSGTQRFEWWIKTGEGKSTVPALDKICPQKAMRLRSGLDWITGAKGANGLQAFAFNYGNIGADCGYIVRAEVRSDGAFLRSLKVTLLDVQQIHKTMRDTHFLLRNKSLEAEIKQKEKSGGVPEL